MASDVSALRAFGIPTIIFVGGILLCVAAFVHGRSPTPRWARHALFVAGVCAIINSLSSATIVLYGTTVSAWGSARLWQVKILSSGAALGTLLVLLSVPETWQECIRGFRRHKRTDDSEGSSGTKE